MGYISPGMVAKKHYNWKIPEDAGPPPVVSYTATLRETLAELEFFAEYQAIFPAVQAFSAAPSGFDPANTGSNLVLSGPNNQTVTLNGTGSTLGVQSHGPLPGDYVLEYVVSGTGGTFPNLGLFSSGGPPFDPEGNFDVSAFSCSVRQNGDVFGGFGIPGTPANIGAINPGDVVGVLFQGDPSGAFFFVNGFLAAEVTPANNVVKAAVGAA